MWATVNSKVKTSFLYIIFFRKVIFAVGCGPPRGWNVDNSLELPTFQQLSNSNDLLGILSSSCLPILS